MSGDTPLKNFYKNSFFVLLFFVFLCVLLWLFSFFFLLLQFGLSSRLVINPSSTLPNCSLPFILHPSLFNSSFCVLLCSFVVNFLVFFFYDSFFSSTEISPYCS